jgi:sugar lactone lactonase YvrE
VNIACVSFTANDLGESPCWDWRSDRLYWIDAWKAHVHSLDPVSGMTDCKDFGPALAGRPIGAIGLHASGGMISSVKGGFYHLDLENDTAHLIAEAETERPATNRLNDGKCDRGGRFWSASVNTDHRTPTGALWCLEADRKPILKQDGLVVGNGIAWSPDDRSMYLADTFTRVVWRYDFDIDSGSLTNRRIFTSTADICGFVDGATVDADGCYWAALFKGGAVAQFAPDGKLMRRVNLPVTNPTMCAFGGPDLDILYVTTACRFLDEAALRDQPLAGRVFAIDGLGACGVPEPRYRT